MLEAISPIDGRYYSKTKDLANYFSEYALIKYRVFVEVQYLQALKNADIPPLNGLTKSELKKIDSISIDFTVEDANAIKEIEKTTNHDVKAVEYFIKSKLDDFDLSGISEMVHFCLTSQDVNNTSLPLSIKDALRDVYYPEFEKIFQFLNNLSDQWSSIPMLSRTHGQPASPTSLGKELRVYVERLQNQINNLKSLPIQAKFGGATGNFNAHKVSFPNVDWVAFANQFVGDLGLTRQQYTTQISHYDDLAAIFHTMSRVNVILIDLCRDIWTYISQEYFGQKIVKGEIGSSTMPHKVNPIDFENAEGNLLYANSIFEFLARKLPVSRLQRDLTDSTVTRNIGVPIAHTIIAFKSLFKGLGKLKLNPGILNADLEANWAVVAEAIQSILRREQFPNPYEALKSLTRGNNKINKSIIHNFIDNLEIDESLKEEMKRVTPHNYIGYTS